MGRHTHFHPHADRRQAQTTKTRQSRKSSATTVQQGSLPTHIVFIVTAVSVMRPVASVANDQFWTSFGWKSSPGKLLRDYCGATYYVFGKREICFGVPEDEIRTEL